MQKLATLLVCFILASCNFINKEVPEKQVLLEQRLQEIDWTEVSRYPSVSTCDSILDKTLQKACFFEFLTRSVQERLDIDTLTIMYPEIDTITVKVIVYPDATIKFEPHYDKELSYGNQKIDSIIQLRLQDFPKIEPAQKEGIPVKSEFVLPIILKVE